MKNEDYIKELKSFHKDILELRNFYLSPLCSDRPSLIIVLANDSILFKLPKHLLQEQIDKSSADKASMLISILKINEIRFQGDEQTFSKHSMFLSNVKQSINIALSNLETEKHSRLIRLRNTLINANSGNTEELHKVKKNKPAIICAAGPSLECDLNILKEYQSKFSIIAVGHAVRTLLNAGIKIDLVLEVDPQCHGNWQFEGKIDSHLYCTVDVSPEVISKFSKVMLFRGDFESVNKVLDRKLPELKLSNSVMISAIDAALQCGFRKIAMTGLNLSFTNGREHSGESAHISTDELFDVEGYDNRQLKAPINLIHVRQALENYLNSINQKYKNLELVNCTVNGAAIKHCDRSTLTEFIDQHVSTNKPQWNTQVKAKTTFSPKVDQLKNALLVFSQISQLAKGWNNFTNTEQRQNELKKFLEVDSELNQSLAVCKILDDQAKDYIADIKHLNQIEKLAYAYDLKSWFLEDIIDETTKCFEKAFDAHVSIKNRELHRWLQGISLHNEKWKIKSRDQQIPYLIHKQYGRFSEYLSMNQTAANHVNNFISENNFNCEHCAVIMPCPGNWSEVIELNKRFPAAHILIIETDIELMQILREFAMFTQYFSKNTLITLQSNQLRRQDKIIKHSIRQWQVNGLEVLIYENKYTKDIPSVKVLIESLKSMFTERLAG